MNILGSTKTSFIYNQNSTPGLTGIALILSQANVWIDASDGTTTFNGSTAVTTANSSAVITKILNKNNKSYYFSSNSGNTFKYNNTFNTSYKGIQVSTTGTWMSYSDPSTLPYTDYSIFVVGSLSSDGGYSFLGIGSSTAVSNNAQLILAYSSNMYISSGAAVANQEYSSNFNSSPYPGGISIKPVIFEYLKTQGTNDGYYTGTAMTYAKNDATTTGSNPQTFCSIFCYNSNGSFAMPASSYISEVLIFPTKLSTSDRQMVEGYQAWKWGFQSYLPSSHPYKSAAPV